MIPLNFDYAQGLNHSHAVMSEIKNNNFGDKFNGKLFSLNDFINSPYSYTATTSITFNELISGFEVNYAEFKNEIIQCLSEAQINERDKFLYKINEIISNLSDSFKNFLNFINFFDNRYLHDNAPVVDIDNDGEIMMEWYGRSEARANLTFGRNGELYFISYFHGETLKTKLYLNQNSLKIIRSELVKLFLDKAA